MINLRVLLILIFFSPLAAYSSGHKDFCHCLGNALWQAGGSNNDINYCANRNGISNQSANSASSNRTDLATKCLNPAQKRLYAAYKFSYDKRKAELASSSGSQSVKKNKPRATASAPDNSNFCHCLGLAGSSFDYNNPKDRENNQINYCGSRNKLTNNRRFEVAKMCINTSSQINYRAYRRGIVESMKTPKNKMQGSQRI